MTISPRYHETKLSLKWLNGSAMKGLRVGRSLRKRQKISVNIVDCYFPFFILFPLFSPVIVCLSLIKSDDEFSPLSSLCPLCFSKAKGNSHWKNVDISRVACGCSKWKSIVITLSLCGFMFSFSAASDYSRSFIYSVCLCLCYFLMWLPMPIFGDDGGKTTTMRTMPRLRLKVSPIFRFLLITVSTNYFSSKVFDAPHWGRREKINYMRWEREKIY